MAKNIAGIYRRELVAERAENERLRAAISKGEFLAQAAGRAIRDNGGPAKFLDLSAAVRQFRQASGTGPLAPEQKQTDESAS